MLEHFFPPHPDESKFCQDFIQLIGDYNLLEKGSTQLLALQQIDLISNRLIQTPQLVNVTTRKALIQWRASDSFELELQRFSIHRDASFLLRQYEYALANKQRHFTWGFEADKQTELYDVLSELYDVVINYSVKLSSYSALIYQNSVNLLKVVAADKQLEEKLLEHSRILSLFYQNMSDTRQGTATFQLERFARKLNPGINNQHFFDKSNKLVYLIEKRLFPNYADQLCTLEAAKYFSDSYITVMSEIEPDKGSLLPVVLTNYYKDGSLADLSQTFSYTEKDFATLIMFFRQMSDFCLKLLAKGFYHSDIKLNNFLISENNLVVADRKAIGFGRSAYVSHMVCTPLYSPFEIVLYYSNNKFDEQKGVGKRVEMAAVMAYQVGVALKVFFMRGTKFSGIEKLNLSSHPSNTVLCNLVILANALTRQNPSQRLSLKEFYNLLPFSNGESAILLKKLRSAGHNEIKPSIDTYEKYLLLMARLLNQPYPLDFEDEFYYLNSVMEFSEGSEEKALAKELIALKTLVNEIVLSPGNTQSSLQNIYSLYSQVKNVIKIESPLDNRLLSKIGNETLGLIETNFTALIRFKDLEKLNNQAERCSLKALSSENVAFFLNRYETMNPERIAKDFLTLYHQFRSKMIGDIKQQINEYSEKTTSSFTKWFSWLNTETNSPRLTLQVMSAHLIASHDVLSQLNPDTISSLFKNEPVLQTIVLPLYTSAQSKNRAKQWVEQLSESKDTSTSLGSLLLDRYEASVNNFSL